MSETEKWLRASARFRGLTGKATRDANGEWAPLHCPEADDSVKDAMVFVWGGGFVHPLHDDMLTWKKTKREADKCLVRAARLCESLAYDGTDGP